MVIQDPHRTKTCRWTASSCSTVPCRPRPGDVRCSSPLRRPCHRAPQPGCTGVSVVGRAEGRRLSRPRTPPRARVPRAPLSSITNEGLRRSWSIWTGVRVGACEHLRGNDDLARDASRAPSASRTVDRCRWRRSRCPGPDGGDRDVGRSDLRRSNDDRRLSPASGAAPGHRRGRHASAGDDG